MSILGHLAILNTNIVVFIDYMLKDEQNALCVRMCPANFYPENNTCVPCHGPCPKCEYNIISFQPVCTHCDLN